jgi:hypothetical protein
MLIGEDTGSGGDREYLQFGVTLYFAEGETKPDGQLQITDSFDVSHVFDVVSAIVTIIKGKGQNEAARTIQKWFSTGHPIVQFFRNCLDGGTGQSRCLSLAKAAGIKYRRQNALALYNILKLEREFTPEKPLPPKTTEPHPAMYEAVREHFENEFAADEFFGQFDYEESELSEADISDLSEEIGPGDFVFEVGELETASFRYWGHYHAATRKFKPIKIYPGFDVQTLFHLLRR